ncbi:Sec7-domain-containing protein, partial [Hanseniaspora valbyensis NRRL Y-1626]
MSDIKDENETLEVEQQDDKISHNEEPVEENLEHSSTDDDFHDATNDGNGTSIDIENQEQEEEEDVKVSEEKASEDQDSLKENKTIKDTAEEEEEEAEKGEEQKEEEEEEEEKQKEEEEEKQKEEEEEKQKEEEDEEEETHKEGEELNDLAENTLTDGNNEAAENEEADDEGNDSVIHKPFNNSQSNLSTNSEHVLHEVAEADEESENREIPETAIEQPPVTKKQEPVKEPLYKYEEDATPEEISKSKNIKSTLTFLKKSFEEFMQSKEFKNTSHVSKSTNKSLTDAIEDINKILSSPTNSIASLNSVTIFEALRSCCRCKINSGKIMALDGLSKLFAFQLLDESVLVNPPDALSMNENISSNSNNPSGITPPPKLKLMDAAIDTITDCFEGEVTNENVELQIIRCLTCLILMEDSLNICHGQSLLKAIRTIYNIFIFSLNSSTQTIAQATLIQVVEKVFQRVRTLTDFYNYNIDVSTSIQNGSILSLNSNTADNQEEQEVEEQPETPLNLNDMKVLNDEEEENIDYNEIREDSITEEQLCIKDAFLVFRSMAKISVKNIEDTLDMRSHAVRSKLLSLHMLHSILRDQVSLFLNPRVKLYSNGDKSLVDSIRQYLCLAISRNATSPVAPVFEITLEILWLLISNLRFYFKREIPIFFTERIAESTTSSLQIFSTSSSSSTKSLSNPNFPILYHLKLDSLRCIILVLRSLSSWADINTTVSSTNTLETKLSRKASISSSSNHNLSDDIDNSNSGINESSRSRSNSEVKLAEEDNEVQQFEVSKLRKTLLSKLVANFNKKPKKAIPDLVAQGFIEDTSSKSIAKFLLTTEGLNLSTVGDYLGEGNEENIAIMHEFVDQLDFKGLSFTDALRNFLQKFRLPGEGQKIDRFMLKFAERFVEQNPDVFAKADTAYVLAYAVIMLNTDLHSPQIKKRMTLEEFIDLTGGVNEPKDLTKEYITGLYDEIQNNEIKLLSEQHEAALAANGGGNTTASGNNNNNNNTAFNFFNMRDLNREAYMQVSKEITSKTENVVKSLSTGNLSKEDYHFYFAGSKEHTNLVFQTLWMSFLASFTTPFNENDDEYPISLCLEGLQHGIRISSYFGIEMARTSFVGALIQFTNLSNVAELKHKNIMAIYKLLEVVLQIGDFLKDSWQDILYVVSQVERLQLIAKGIDRNSVPDVSSSRLKSVNSRISRDSVRS